MKYLTPLNENASEAPHISIVIPTYRNAIGLNLLADRLAAVLHGLGKYYEVIFIDDCSPDNSWAVIEEITNKHKGFRGILLGKNIGQARATLCGIHVARGDIIVTMDDDLQHEPEALPMLLTQLNEDDSCDALFAWFPEKEHSYWRNLGSRVVRYLNNQAFGLGNVKISSYRLMRKNVAEFIRANRSSIATPGAMILAATRHVKSIPIRHHQRAFGTSNYTFWRQIRLTLTNLFAVSLLPLRFISIFGMTTASLSAIMLIGILARYFTTGFGVPGWATLVTLITFFSGAILLSLGVIGEYLVRVLRELQYSDAAPIRRTIGFQS